MDNGEYFDYLLDCFDKEHHLVKLVLIGEDDAIRLLVLDEDDNKFKEHKEEGGLE